MDCSNAFFTIFDVFKIVHKIVFFLVKFNEKHDGTMDQLLWATILKVGLNFLLESLLAYHEIDLLQFWRWIPIQKPS